MKIENWKLNRGYVTITVLILMMVLVAASYLYADALFSELAIARNNKGASVAFSLAEAGVQEAIYRVQHDTETRNKFMETEDGTTIFSHDSALIPQGGYSVTIQNTAEASAIVTAVGTYRIGTLRTAQRKIEVGIAQSETTPYTYDGAIFSVAGPGESMRDIDFWFALVNIFNGSILSNKDINFKFGNFTNIEKTIEANNDVVNQWSIVNCNCMIEDDGDPETPQCSDLPGCTPLENVPQKNINGFNFEYYKAEAIKQNQYFTKQKDFKDLIPKFGSKTFDGVVYIDDSLDVDYARTINMNGVLATSGSISISLGQILINRSESGAAGVVTPGDIRIETLANLTGVGLVYAGKQVRIDASIPYNMNLTGAFIARKFWISGFRIVNIHFDSDVVNDTYIPIITEPVTPVIEINHWEEEY